MARAPRHFRWKVSVAVASRVLGALAAVGLHFYAAATFSPSVVGSFFTGLAILALLSALARLGLDNSILRRAARLHLEASEPIRPLGPDFLLAAASACTFALLMALGALIARANGYGDIGLMLVALAPALAFLSIGALLLEALKGLRKTASALFLQSGAASLFALMFLVFLGKGLPDRAALGIAYSLGTVVATAAALVLVLRSARVLGGAPLNFSVAAMLRSLQGAVREGRVLLLIAVGGIATGRMPLLVSSAVGGQADAAVYGVGAKLSDALVLLLAAVNAHYAPRMAAAWAEGRPEVVKMYWGKSVVVLAVLGVAAGAAVTAVAVVFFPRIGYEQAVPVHIAIVVGQIVNLATGSVGFVLMMTDNERSLAVSVWTGLAIAVPISLWLAAIIGPVGAAMGGALALFVTNGLSVRAALLGPLRSRSELLTRV